MSVLEHYPTLIWSNLYGWTAIKTWYTKLDLFCFTHDKKRNYKRIRSDYRLKGRDLLIGYTLSSFIAFGQVLVGNNEENGIS